MKFLQIINGGILCLDVLACALVGSGGSSTVNEVVVKFHIDLVLEMYHLIKNNYYIKQKYCFF